MTVFLLFMAYALILTAALARAGHRSRPAAAGGGSRQPPSRLLIIGATGGTGRQLVTQALERGYAVTALVRDPSGIQVDHPKLTVAGGDVLDAGSVEKAVRGQDAVLCALGHKRSGVGDRAARVADQPRRERSTPSRSRYRELSSDGTHCPCGRRRVHAGSARV